MNWLNDKYLIKTEYVFSRFSIRALFYGVLIATLSLIISVSTFKFSVDFTVKGEISDLNNTYEDSSQLVPDKLIRIELTPTLSDFLVNRQKVEVEIIEDSILSFKQTGEIVQYIMDKGNNKEEAFSAIIANDIINGKIKFFPAEISNKSSAIITIKDVRIGLNNLLIILKLKDLYTIDIAHFT